MVVSMPHESPITMMKTGNLLDERVIESRKNLVRTTYHRLKLHHCTLADELRYAQSLSTAQELSSTSV